MRQYQLRLTLDTDEGVRVAAQGLAEVGHEEREAMRVTLAVADASAAVQPIADTLDAALAAYLTTSEPEG